MLKCIKSLDYKSAYLYNRIKIINSANLAQRRNFMSLILDYQTNSVVALGRKNDNGTTTWIATGFLVAKKLAENQYYIFLVTNRHVFLAAGPKMIMRLNRNGGLEAKDVELSLSDEKNRALFSFHENDKIDIACMQIINTTEIEKEIGQWSVFLLDESTLTRSEMIANGVTEGTIVYSLGFPIGLVGVNSKMPLCRMGCISRIKELAGPEEYLLDIQNFPGSSGSPIINRPEIMHFGNEKSFTKSCLIGIVSGYIPYIDTLYSKQTGKSMQIIQENSGIATIFTVDAIKQTVEREFERANAVALQD